MKQVDLAVAMNDHLSGQVQDHYRQSMISMVESGQRSLRFEGAAAAARALGVSLDYLAGLTDDPAPAAQRSSHRFVTDLDSADPGDVPGARPVPVRELAAAAGGGALDLDETIVGYLYFRLDWLDRHALDPSQCDVIRVSGESMEPTLPEGCSILVDRARRRRRHDRIYVIRTDHGIVVKRSGRVPGGHWQMISDHPAWRPRPWPPAAEIIGEVRWMARLL